MIAQLDRVKPNVFTDDDKYRWISTLAVSYTHLDVYKRQPKDWYEGEIGKIAGVRFVETTEAKIWAKAAKDKATGTAVASSRAVYSTLVLADNAYGVTEIEGGGLQHIVKQLGSAGTADALDQRATCGWKATKVAERLVENFMIRIESTSTSNPAANN